MNKLRITLAALAALLVIGVAFVAASGVFISGPTTPTITTSTTTTTVNGQVVTVTQLNTALHLTSTEVDTVTAANSTTTVTSTTTISGTCPYPPYC